MHKVLGSTSIFIARKDGIQSSAQFLIGFHFKVFAQFVTTVGTRENIGTERSLQTIQTNVVRANSSDGFVNNFLTADAQETLLNLGDKFLNKFLKNKKLKINIR